MVDLPSRGYKGRIYLGSFLRHRPLWLEYEGDEKLSNYQVKCVLTNSDIPFEKLRSDKQDLLFISYDGEVLPYWIEKADNSEIIIWLKFPEIPPGKEVFRLYYGNGKFPGASDGEATFDFFDDFDDGVVDTTKWRDWDGTAIEENGLLKLEGNTNDIHFYSKISFGTKYIVRAQHLRGDDGGLFFNVQDGDNGYLIALHDTASEDDTFKLWKRQSGSWSSLASSNPLKDTEWHVYEIRVEDGSYEFFQDDDSKLSASDSTWTTGYVGIRGYSTHSTYTDWFLVRKYASPEPSVKV